MLAGRHASNNSIVGDGIGLKISAVHIRELPIKFRDGCIDELMYCQLTRLISLHTLSSLYITSHASPQAL